jgi:hypothetical protein
MLVRLSKRGTGIASALESSLKWPQDALDSKS